MNLRVDVLHRWLLAALCVFCVGFKFLDVLYAQYTLDPDAGVVALMARHMAEGIDFPVFFYGQPYMGSFEPAVSALLFRIFGASELVLCIGTALIGLLVLPVTYQWARDAAGRWAGLVALAFLAIGPVGYYPYLSVPRGGYAVIILVDVLVLLLSTRILVREWNRERADWKMYLALGLVAGVGWWTSALMAASLGVAGLLFICVMRWRLVAWRVLLAAFAFVIGSTPFWIWNIRHGWASFIYYAEGARKVMFFHNLGRLFPDRFLLLMGLDDASTWWATVTMLMLGIGLFSGFCFLIRAIRRGNVRAAIPLIAVAFFLLLSIFLFCDSNFARLHTPRYLAPLAPAIAVMFGAGVVWLYERVRWFAAIPLLVLVVSQAGDVGPMLDKAVAQRSQRKEFTAFIQYVQAAGHDVVYCEFAKYWLNFMSHEAVCFTPLIHERYAPDFERAERTDTPVVAGNYGYVREFLYCSGGTARCDRVVSDFVPPLGAEYLIARDRIAAISTPEGGDALDLLTDGSVDTCVKRLFQTNALAEEYFTIRLRAPASVAGFRLFSRNFMYPRKLRVEGRTSASDDWMVLKKNVIAPGLYWSGPRPFWGGRFKRLECRFEPVRISEMRIYCLETDPRLIWQFAELDVFEPGPPSVPESTAISDLLTTLKTIRLDRLYGSRWVNIKVHNALAGEVKTAVMDIKWELAPDKMASNHMVLSESCGILVLAEDADLTRRALTRRRVAMTEKISGPWILFYFGPGQWCAEYAMDHGLYWSGYACFTCDNVAWAFALLIRARSDFVRTGDIDQAVTDMQEVLAICPHWGLAGAWLEKQLKDDGRLVEAEQWADRAMRLSTPDTPFSIKFGNGLELTGISTQPGPFAPGAIFHIRYFWKCPDDYQKKLKSAFVHFRLDGAIVFQDDHVVLKNHDTRFQPLPLVCVEERDVCIPSNAPTGSYEIGLGLCDPRSAMNREEMSTSLPVSRRMAFLPVRLDILNNPPSYSTKTDILHQGQP